MTQDEEMVYIGGGGGYTQIYRELLTYKIKIQAKEKIIISTSSYLPIMVPIQGKLLWSIDLAIYYQNK